MACRRGPECRNDTDPGTRYIRIGPAVIRLSVSVVHGSVPMGLSPGVLLELGLCRVLLLAASKDTTLAAGCVYSVSIPSGVVGDAFGDV